MSSLTILYFLPEILYLQNKNLLFYDSFTTLLRQQIRLKGNIIHTRPSNAAIYLQVVILILMVEKSLAKLYLNIIKCSFDIISRVCRATSCKHKTLEFVSLMR